MNRRKLFGAAAAGGTLAMPAVATAQTTFTWRMTSFYGPQAAFYSTGPGSARDLIDRIQRMSNNRLRIQFFGAGELIPAAEGFDAVSSGIVEMNYANAYFWTGKTFAAQYFTAVPFGLNFQGLNGWMYDGGGLDLWREVYDRFNLVPFLCGNTGVQMTGWFRRPINTVEDFRGLKMRIPGLAGRVAKHYYTTGWHETATASELIINKAAWARLPNDLKAIVENAVAACNVISEAWCQKNNAEAMEDLIRNHGVEAKQLPDDVVARLREENTKVLEAAVARDPVTRRVHESYMAYKAKFDAWSNYSEVPYHTKIRPAS